MNPPSRRRRLRPALCVIAALMLGAVELAAQPMRVEPVPEQPAPGDPMRLSAPPASGAPAQDSTRREAPWRENLPPLPPVEVGLTPFSTPTVKVPVPATPRPQGTRVFIHHSRASPEDRMLAYRLTEHLAEDGFYIADIRPVDQSIRGPSVRYFFDSDREASEAVLNSLKSFYEAEGLGPLTTTVPAGFVHYSPKPHDGTIEIWLPTR